MNSKSILPFQNTSPQIPSSCFLAPQSVVIGDVVLGEGSSVWFNTVVRGDVNVIRIGKNTNIQDLSVIHVTNRNASKPAATHIGDEVTVGHRVIIHGATIGNRCLIGMGAVIMDGAEIGDEVMIGAGALVTPHTKIPPRVLALGSPAKVVRPLTPDELNFLPISAAGYVELAKIYLGK